LLQVVLCDVGVVYAVVLEVLCESKLEGVEGGVR